MRHEFTNQYGESYRCGNSYCTGHRERELVCSCGWVKKLGEHIDGVDLEFTKIKHRLDWLDGTTSA
jgi:hypothetical protein